MTHVLKHFHLPNVQIINCILSYCDTICNTAVSEPGTRYYLEVKSWMTAYVTLIYIHFKNESG